MVCIGINIKDADINQVVLLMDWEQFSLCSAQEVITFLLAFSLVRNVDVQSPSNHFLLSVLQKYLSFYHYKNNIELDMCVLFGRHRKQEIGKRKWIRARVAEEKVGGKHLWGREIKCTIRIHLRRESHWIIDQNIKLCTKVHPFQTGRNIIFCCSHNITLKKLPFTPMSEFMAFCRLSLAMQVAHWLYLQTQPKHILVLQANLNRGRICN